jgi:hypothetical protein
MNSLDKITDDKELSFVFIMMHVNAVMYFAIGLVFNEPHLIKALKLQKVIDMFLKEDIKDPKEKKMNAKKKL